VLAAFCNELEPLYLASVRGDRGPFEAWKRRLVSLGEQVRVIAPDRTFEGKAVDVEDDGALVVVTPDGARHRVEAGDVSLRPA